MKDAKKFDENERRRWDSYCSSTEWCVTRFHYISKRTKTERVTVPPQATEIGAFNSLVRRVWSYFPSANWSKDKQPPPSPWFELGRWSSKLPNFFVTVTEETKLKFLNTGSNLFTLENIISWNIMSMKN